MSKKLFFTIGSLLFTLFIANAQTPSWQWGKRGGGPVTGGTYPDEKVVDMATDSHGNIYVLGQVYQPGVNVDGNTITGWGSRDWLLTSFKCDGTYRWSKDIGGSTSGDIPVAIKTDTLGGVYLVGYVSANVSGGAHIDVDATTGYTFQTLLLVKYDTAGVYKWFRLPQANTVGAGTLSYDFPYDMDVDGAGNSYLLCELSPGTYGGGAFTASAQGEYMLKYDKNGNFISGNTMDITVTGFLTGGNTPFLFMKRNPHSGKFYITGFVNSSTLAFGSSPITHALFVASFNSAGTFLWQKQDTHYGGGFARPDIDASGGIYLTAGQSTGDTFNTYVITNAFYPAPFITKMDSNGTFIWAKNATTNADAGCSAGGATSCSCLNGGEIEIAGACGNIKWPGFSDSLNLPLGSGERVFTTRFNSTSGAVLGLDSLISPAGTYVQTNALAADRYGNFYVGGNFQTTITVNGTTLTSAGGGSDFFVAKYGTSNCSVPITLETSPDLSKGEEILRVYPNPATEELNITGITQNTTYRLLSITGTTVLQGLLKQGENTIQMRNCASGLYILQMNGEDGQRNMVKVVKQ